ncbi:VOC family protein [Flagellimonas sp.]|uniref:VOC family protein n=1 Tax=Flagellimonas sp. TaxID=2058762 RepID=UPI003F4A6158
MNRIFYLFIVLFLLQSCNNKATTEELNALQTELDSLKKQHAAALSYKKEQIATFLTFQENNAEEAMNFYINLFENSKVIDIQRYGNEGPAKEGTIFVATFELNGSRFMCSDSYIKHEWDFTPGVSIWVDCKSEEEINTLFTNLSANGQVLMPMDNYGFSTKFAFIEDRFGVSWQLNLE